MNINIKQEEKAVTTPPFLCRYRVVTVVTLFFSYTYRVRICKYRQVTTQIF